MDDKLDPEMKRILLKFLILKVIRENPTHGYDIIQIIERKSNGRWTPSPGSVYPALDSLESKGWIKSEDSGRLKRYTITSKGQIALDQWRKKWREQIMEIARLVDDTMADDTEGSGDIDKNTKMESL